MEEELRELSARRHLLLAAYLLTAAAYAAAVACVFINFTAAVWIVNIATVFYVAAVRTMDRRYNRAFARANLAMSCGRPLEERQILNKGTLTRDELRALQLFPMPAEGKGLVCGMQLSGRHQGMQVQACELTAYYEVAGGKRKLNLLSGLWMQLQLPADTGLQLVLLQQGLLEQGTAAPWYAAQGMESLPVLESSLRDRFALYGSTGSAGTAAQFIRRCLALTRQAEKSGGRLLLAVRGDRLCLFLSGRSLSFSTPIRGRLTPEIVGWDRLPELGLFLDLGGKLPRPRP